jgi:chemosensory pili system protein ChpA (sensor histidine kinase/response regulator)
MANPSQAAAGSAIDIGVNDLGPLAWVLDELRKSLDSATKALRRYVRDAELAKGSDLNAADASQLRIARQQLHQSVGALEMVGFAVPAQMLRGMEGAVQKFVAKPELCTDVAATRIERASFALLGYLEALLLGKSPSAVELFSQYSETQELAGASRIHPADLWIWPWQWRAVADTGVAAVALDAAFRARFDKAALQVVKLADVNACADLAQFSASLANQTELKADTNFASFWRIAAGALEAVATGSLKPDLHFKRTVSRLLIQLATHIKGDLSVPDRLAQDLLFFCAQASPQGMAPLLGEVRMAYGLGTYAPVDYSKSYYGQFDPTLLVQARKRIGQLKETWSAFTAGELSKAKPVQDQMSLLVDSIDKLLPGTGKSLAAAMNEVIDSTARIQKPPEATLGMEVATAILYLEASFEDFDPDDKQQASRMAHLAQRLQMARGGAASQPLESWMEELYRRVSDRQTMGSVVGELKLTLGELEKLMDAYFRDPQDKVLLSDVPSRLVQMRGVLTVLGLDQASLAVSRMRESIEQILVTEIDVDKARAAGTFDKLGNNLGALGFLIDMLSYQPVLAKKLFVYDESEGELKPLMGRTVDEPAPLEASPANLTDFNPDATIPFIAEDVAKAVASAPSPAAPATVVVVDADEVDPELLEIFLEEAREVAGNGLAATEALVNEPNNIGEMTTLRRAFHTLKGSSRMVGLNVFGEAAWSMEQVMNAWLAEQKPASPQLCELSTQALRAQQTWIEEIAIGQGKQRSAQHGKFEPLQFEAVAPQVAEPRIEEAPLSAVAGAGIAAATVAIAVAAPVPESAEFVLPTLELPELSLPVIEPAAEAAPQKANEPDFSLHLGDLDQGLVQAPVLDMLSPEPHVTIATPAAAPELPAPAVSEVKNDFDLDMDFDFEVAAEPSAPPAVVELTASEASLTAEPGSSVDWSMPTEEVLPQTAPAADALITADELAAFEQAMMAMGSPEASVDNPAPELLAMDVSEGQPSDDPAINSLDFEALAALSGHAAATGATAQAPSESLPSEADSFAMDFTSASTMPAALEPAPVASTPSDLGIDLGSGFSSSSSPAAGAYQAEEQFKAVGPLRVSLPLYNVYLNEADEWSRRLAHDLTEWSLDPSAKLPADCVAFAHSLAGSSATVGFSSLSALARSLEHTLLHMQRIEEDGDYDPHAHSALFVKTGEEIRHLLHQFAAGFLKDYSPDIEAELSLCMQAPFAVEAPVLTDESAQSDVDIDFAPELSSDEAPGSDSVESISLDLSTFDDVQELPEITPKAASLETAPSAMELLTPAALAASAAAVVSAAVATEPASDEVAPVVIAPPEPAPKAATVPVEPVAPESLSVAPVLAVRSRQLAAGELDDEIDAVDALDPDLFEIFEEEAQELFPSTASALRQWTARPDNMSARAEVLRGLHTLKGSARLAGAMRLGELAHRMESSVESIPHEGAQSADIEALMAQLDGMQYNFDVLRNPALAPEPRVASVAPAVVDAVPDSSTVSNAPTDASSSSVVPMRPVAAAVGMVAPSAPRTGQGQTVRVRAQLLDRLMNQAGEVMITRARLEAELSQLRGSLTDLTGNLEKLRSQLRELDVQAESQMQTRIQQAKETEASFDPLEFDRYTRVQELTRMMAESVNDVATVQRNIQRTIESTEDDLIAQARQTRDLQRDLLRTRMVEFEGISERLYRVVRQAGKDAGKQVKLDILGGTIEMDRGVLDRMTPAFEHLLRNCVAHGIESAEERTAAGKSASGEIVITLHQEGNDVSIQFRDDGAGLNIARIREKAIAQGLLANDTALADAEAANLIFTPGFSTATTVTELSGRGVGMDVVRSEVVALGGRIETATTAGQGTSFKLVLPLTTAVTQVVMVRIGELAIGVPANLIEIVRRATLKDLQTAYNSGTYEYAGEQLPFFWAGALLQHSSASQEPASKTMPVAVFRSAAQRIAVHIDEVLGNQEVVVKNLGPQLSRLPGLAGMTVLASGAVALIYNPVALATVYGQQARAMSFDPAQPHALESQSQPQDVSDAVARDLTPDAKPVVPLVPANPASISPPAVPLVLVVDDSITVRRVTQRLLQREGYRVAMAADGLQALERLTEELPSVILSDIEMPRMDGFDLLRNVRADEKLKHLPTIMITSRIAEKHREYAFELGANHYLGKPYNEEELLSLIRRYAREEATV